MLGDWWRSNVLVDWFYSDPHMGHKKICELAGRPFADVTEMNAELLRRYNAVVGPGDTVLWCGDTFFMPVEEAARWLAMFNGHKIACIGNHDGSKSRLLKTGFSIVMDTCYMRIAGRTCLVNHYPYAALDRVRTNPSKYPYPQKVKGEMLIHGHTHSKLKMQGSAIHVGVDAWDYYPVPFAGVQELVRRFGPASEEKT